MLRRAAERKITRGAWKLKKLPGRDSIRGGIMFHRGVIISGLLIDLILAPALVPKLSRGKTSLRLRD